MKSSIVLWELSFCYIFTCFFLLFLNQSNQLELILWEEFGLLEVPFMGVRIAKEGGVVRSKGFSVLRWCMICVQKDVHHQQNFTKTSHFERWQKSQVTLVRGAARVTQAMGQLQNWISQWTYWVTKKAMRVLRNFTVLSPILKFLNFRAGLDLPYYWF